MRTDTRYTTTSCFETFPFPKPDPRTVFFPKLEKLGEQLYEARAKYMLDAQQGLTKTYNALKDPSCTDRRILALREQHEAMDAAVLAEYGWQHVKVPPFCAKTDKDTREQDAFKAKVIDLLYKLNAERAREEELAGLEAGKKKGKGLAARAIAQVSPSEPANSNGDKSDRKHGTAASDRPGLRSARPPSKSSKRTSGGRS